MCFPCLFLYAITTYFGSFIEACYITMSYYYETHFFFPFQLAPLDVHDQARTSIHKSCQNLLSFSFDFHAPSFPKLPKLV